MKLYLEDLQLIETSSYRDPLLSYLTCVLMKRLGNGYGKTLIDLGCGTGRNSIEAAKKGWQVTGIDVSSKALQIAKVRARNEKIDTKVDFRRADLFAISRQKLGSFDACILSEVIEHVEDYQRIIDSAYSLLKPGGVLLLTTPNDPAQWSILDDYAEHVRRFLPQQLTSALSAFQTVKLTTIGFPFMRSFIWIYVHSVSIFGGSHRPQTFRNSRSISSAYFFLGSMLLRLDALFGSTLRGTTLIAEARKATV